MKYNFERGQLTRCRMFTRATNYKNLIDALHSTPFSAFWDHLITTFEHHRLRCQIARSLELVHLARSNKSISVLNIDNVCPALCVIYTLIMHSWTIKIISFVFWWKFLFWQDSIKLPNSHNSFVSIWLFCLQKTSICIH